MSSMLRGRKGGANSRFGSVGAGLDLCDFCTHGLLRSLETIGLGFGLVARCGPTHLQVQGRRNHRPWQHILCSSKYYNIIMKEEGMDLERSSTGKNTFYCFNPRCPAISKRVFSEELPHAGAKLCKPWIIEHDDIFHPKQEEISLESPEIKIDLLHHPISTIFQAYNKKAVVKQQLQQFIEVLEKSLRGTIQTVKSVLEMKMNRLFQFFQAAGEETKSLLSTIHSYHPSEIVSYRIEEIIQKTNLKELPRENLVLFPKEKLRYCIENIGKSVEDLIDEVYRYNGASCRSNQEQVLSLEKYLWFDEKGSENKISKLQNLSQVLKTPVSDFYTRSSKKTKQTKLICLLCQYEDSYFGRRTTFHRNQFYDKYLEHYLEKHLDKIVYNYSHLISKKAIFEVQIRDIIYLMKGDQYEGLDIIYTWEGKKMYDIRSNNRQRLQIQILYNLNQTQNCPTKFMRLTNDRQLAMIIAILLHEVCQNLKKSVNFYTSKIQQFKWEQFSQDFLIQNIFFSKPKPVQVLSFEEQEATELRSTTSDKVKEQ